MSNTSRRHFAIGLEQHRERAELRRDREQIGGALALLPERACVRRADGAAGAARARPPRGTSPRRAPCRRAAARTSASTSSAAGSSSAGIGRRFGLGKPTTNPSSVHIVSTSTPGLGARRARPPPSPTARGRVRRTARARRSRQSPSSSRRALDHDGAVVGHGAGGRGLVGEIAQQVLGRALIEVVVLRSAAGSPRRAASGAGCAPARRCGARAPAAGRPRPPSRTASSPAVPERGRPARDRA